MTSTEFTVGLGESARVSSKVLKPPGGGSSDIFGLGSNSEKTSTNKSTTHSRLFGNPSDPPITPPQKKNTLHQSSIFQNGHEAPHSHKKSYVLVRRNPITGEDIVVDAENEKTDSDKEVKVSAVVEEDAESVPKTVQTSIRVRNPPGGKSSGIF